jgi:hypothetical protein
MICPAQEHLLLHGLAVGQCARGTARGDGEPPERVNLKARSIVRDSRAPPEDEEGSGGLEAGKSAS